MRVASQRLIEASARLDPGDRALLSLLVNHGLDDDALARMMGQESPQIEARRHLLAERLGALLELPPEFVFEELESIAGSAREAHSTNGARPAAPPEDPPAPEPPQPPPPVLEPPAVALGPQPAVPEESGETRRRRWWLFLALLIAVGIAVLLVVLLSGGRSPRSRHASKPAAVRDRTALATLPGGPVGATGTIGLSGPAATPNLVIAVSGLPSAGSGHYEVWLYNSVIDSRPLARLGATGGSATVPLPAGYRHYVWVDVSLQPAGTIVHSGISVVRAAVPSDT